MQEPVLISSGVLRGHAYDRQEVPSGWSFVPFNVAIEAFNRLIDNSIPSKAMVDFDMVRKVKAWRKERVPSYNNSLSDVLNTQQVAALEELLAEEKLTGNQFGMFDLICRDPVTHLIMQDPVTLIDGNTHDRATIEASGSKDAAIFRCPLTPRMTFGISYVIPCYPIRHVLEHFKPQIDEYIRRAFPQPVYDDPPPVYTPFSPSSPSY